MPRRMARQVEHDHAAVAKNILVAADLLQRTAATQPMFQRLGALAAGFTQRPYVSLGHKQFRLRKARSLPRVVPVGVAYADDRDRTGRNLDLRQLILDSAR